VTVAKQLVEAYFKLIRCAAVVVAGQGAASEAWTFD
jgi:hypothetical protein